MSVRCGHALDYLERVCKYTAGINWRRSMDNIGNDSEKPAPDETSDVMGKSDRIDADVMRGADRIDADDMGGADRIDADDMGGADRIDADDMGGADKTDSEILGTEN
jgi:hypothetical protein